MTVLPGVRNMQDLTTALNYVTASPGEKDYSVMGEFTPQDAEGICVYCNHCQPCPKGIDVGLMTISSLINIMTLLLPEMKWRPGIIENFQFMQTHV